MTGRIVPSDATSATIRRMSSFRSFQVIVIAVDASGRPFNSSAVYVRTLEGGKIAPFSCWKNLSLAFFLLRAVSVGINQVGEHNT